jgi:arylsulfatase A-like enzyme
MPRTNLLFIQCDQLSASALGAAGCPYVHTPHLDRLAASSFNFHNTSCAFPKCVPSRTAWTYGRMPHQLFLPGTELDYDARPGDPARGVRPEFARQSLGHWFSSAGYRAAFAGKWHVGQWGPTESLRPEHDSGFEILGPLHDPGTTAACARFLAAHPPADRPFLLVASYDNPHNICEYSAGTPLPWGPLPPAPPPSALPPFPGNFHAAPHEPAAVRQRRREVAQRLDYTPEDWRRYRWAYHRLVEKLDAEVGALLDALAASPHAATTAVVFTSDHGDMQGAHGLADKDALYEEAVRVPFFLRLPAAHAQAASPAATDQLVNNALDLFPTLCDLAGIAQPPGLPGRSLVPRAPADAPAYPPRPYIAAELKYRFGGGEARMIRTPRFKYVCHDRGPLREQLFDLRADPRETENLADCAVFASVLAEHRAHLRDWLARSADPFGETHYAFPEQRVPTPELPWRP